MNSKLIIPVLVILGFLSGFVSAEYYWCADTDEDGENTVNDLAVIVDFMFLGGPNLKNSLGDITGDCRVEVYDLTWFVEWLFRDGAPPQCNMECSS